MALLDLVVDTKFRNEQVGRIVSFPGFPRNRGFLVKSQNEELRIRSFLKMFYSARLSILLLGLLLGVDWGRELAYAMGEPLAFLPRIGATLSFCALLAGVPYWVLWRIYKKAVPSFVSLEDAVLVSGPGTSPSPTIVLLVLLVLLLLLGIILLGVRTKA